MHKIRLIVYFAFLSQILTASAFPKQTAPLLENEASFYLRKLYLHTDREYYFIGDTIWFKCYYLDGETHQFVPGYDNLYAGLVDPEGHTILQQVLRIEQGETSGSMIIPDSLEPGNFLLRAYTGEMEPFGEDLFFHKTLKVSRVRSTLDQPGEEVSAEEMEIDLAVLPEGGILLEGIENVVAIKAIDHLGRGLPLNGTITDGKGGVAATFSTGYRGMDTLILRPLAGAKYTIHIEEYPGFEKKMDDPVARGIKIGLAGVTTGENSGTATAENGDELLFRITTNADEYTGKEYYFAIMHSGRVIFDQRFILREKDFPVKVNRTALPPGINRFILLDADMKPISERLYFSRQTEINPIRVVPDQDHYTTRSPVSIDFFDGEDTGGNAFSHLSVAVVDEKAVPENGPGIDILSWLLVSSELTGRIETPADYFRDGELLSSEGKLDLLMLTHGWSSYLWNDLPEISYQAEDERDEGISLTGTINNPLTKRPIQNAEVMLSVYSPEVFIQAQTIADREGRFIFDSIVFADTASALIRATNSRGSSYTLVSLDPLFEEPAEVPEQYLPVAGVIPEFPAGLNEQQYYNDRALQEYAIKSGAILLEEVTIYEQKREDDGHYRIYPKPVNSMEITNRDIAYRNVADYLQGRVSGIMVVGDMILMRGIGSFSPTPPLFVLDGSPLMSEDANEIINSIPMANIDVIEVLKNPNEAAIFGVNAGSGVISIFTKKGLGPFYDSYRQGTLTERIRGYEPYREFYSPKYNAENVDAERPDRRITLYWDPEIVTLDGRATLSFFTCDDVARYRIYVEGITQTGEVCLGSASFTVETGQPVLIE